MDTVDTRMEALSRRMGLAHFNQLTGQSYEDMPAINDAIGRIMRNPENLEIIEHWFSRVTDPSLKRRLEIFRRSFRSARITEDPDLFRKTHELQGKIIGFSPEIDGRSISRTERNRILESEPDREMRRTAYYAGKILDDQIEDDVLSLMELRNMLARQHGYDDYIDFGLQNQELRESELMELFEQIRILTDEGWRDLLEDARQELNVRTLMPWDLNYYIESVMTLPPPALFPKDRIIPVFKSVLKDCGGDLDSLPIDVIIQDIPYGGLCMTIDFTRDIRILSNPRNGFMSYDTLFHEFGHGIHASGLDNASYLVAAGDPPFFWEGIAGLYEHLMQTDHVLKTYFDLDDDAIDQIARRSRYFRMSWFRNIAVVCQVEWAAYRGERNLRALMRELHTRYLGYELPDDVGWAGNTLYTTHPLYNQNYMMMDVMALQTIEAVRKRFGAYPCPEMFEAVNRSYIQPSGWIPWRDKICEFTGEALSADALGRYLASSSRSEY